MPTAPPLDDTPLLLDNDVFTHWRNQSPYAVAAINDYFTRLKAHPKLAAITIFEAQWGIEKLAQQSGPAEALAQRRAVLQQLMQTCGVLDFNQRAATVAAYIFARLSKSQRNKHWKDVFVAATALAYSHGVATGNRQDFELIGQHLPSYAPLLHLAIWKP